MTAHDELDYQSIMYSTCLFTI